MPIHLFRRACVRGIITVCLSFTSKPKLRGARHPLLCPNRLSVFHVQTQPVQQRACGCWNPLCGTGEGAACLEESFVPVAIQSTDLRPTPQRNKIVTKICLLCSFQKTVHGYHDIREEQSVLSLSAFPEGTHDGNAPDTGIAR